MIEQEDEFAYLIRVMPDQCTRPGYEFARELIRLWRFSESAYFGFLQQAKMDKRPTGMDIAEALGVNISKFPSAAKLLRTAEALATTAPDTIEKKARLFDDNTNLMGEMIFARAVDNYLVYLVEILMSIYATNPNMLKSAKQVDYEFILGHEGMQELRQALAERYLNDLAYKPFKEFIEQCGKQGIDLFLKKTSADEIDRLVEERNIVTHNRGKVNALFKKRQPDYPVNIGDTVKAGDNYQGAVEALAASAFDIDVRMTKKFKLETVFLRTKGQNV